jgi:hypothetical protein
VSPSTYSDSGGRRREVAAEGDLATEVAPQFADPRPLGELALFLVPADRFPEGRKVKKVNAHGARVYACGRVAA